MSTSASPVTSDGPGTAADADSSSTGDGTCVRLVTCDGNHYECGDGVDNDGDGLIDAEDLDCVGACDPTEEAFGLLDISDDPICVFDCGFDGNEGAGDDMCSYVAFCDPLQPVEYCEYMPGGPVCAEGPVTVTEQCLSYCAPRVPNGCDCFGCCELDTPQGVRAYFLDDDDCTIYDGLVGCRECTPHIEECGNPCEPEACEICIGQTEPPPGCAAPACVGGQACESTCDCDEGKSCVAGCCL